MFRIWTHLLPVFASSIDQSPKILHLEPERKFWLAIMKYKAAPCEMNEIRTRQCFSSSIYTHFWFAMEETAHGFRYFLCRSLITYWPGLKRWFVLSLSSRHQPQHYWLQCGTLSQRFRITWQSVVGLIIRFAVQYCRSTIHGAHRRWTERNDKYRQLHGNYRSSCYCFFSRKCQVTQVSVSISCFHRFRSRRKIGAIVKGCNLYGRSGRNRCIQCRKWKQKVSCHLFFSKWDISVFTRLWTIHVRCAKREDSRVIGKRKSSDPRHSSKSPKETPRIQAANWSFKYLEVRQAFPRRSWSRLICSVCQRSPLVPSCAHIRHPLAS